MLITEKKFCIFKIMNIYFIEEPVRENVLDSDVITYHTYKNLGDIKGYERKKSLTTIIDLSQDINVIWNKINRQNKRHIKRAMKNGTNVTISDNYEWFFQINRKCIKQKRHVFPIGLNILPLKFIQKYGILFIAENQGEILGGNLYLIDEDNALFIAGACKKIENNIENKKCSVDANCYLHWKAMQYFKNLNIINYDFGEISCDQININHQMSGGDYFKRCFGGDVISRYQYLKFNSRLNRLLFDSWNFFTNSFLIPAQINQKYKIWYQKKVSSRENKI